jgi:hypothetical protein
MYVCTFGNSFMQKVGTIQNSDTTALLLPAGGTKTISRKAASLLTESLKRALHSDQP